VQFVEFLSGDNSKTLDKNPILEIKNWPAAIAG